MIKQFIDNYIFLPIVFILLYGGMLIAAIRDRMKAEDRARKFGF